MSKGTNTIIHTALVLDASGSMGHLSASLIKVVDNQIQHLAKRSKEWDCEIRVSIYLFNDSVKVVTYDRDVLRLPSIRDFYRASGCTALIDGTAQAIQDLRKVPELYADHSFLIYTFTDGDENVSQKHDAQQLKKMIESLPDNYTLAAFVPDANGVADCKMYGFPAQNICVWSTTQKGIEEVGRQIQTATDNFVKAAQSGVKGTKNLFSVDTKSLTKSAISSLEALKANEYSILQVRKDDVIKPFVESWKIPYRQGMAYYQLTKTEKIQAQKQICIREKKSGKVYSGPNARQLLGLPNYEVKVAAAQHPLYDIFVQSSSYNRKLVAGTELIVIL